MLDFCFCGIFQPKASARFCFAGQQFCGRAVRHAPAFALTEPFRMSTPRAFLFRQTANDGQPSESAPCQVLQLWRGARRKDGFAAFLTNLLCQASAGSRLTVAQRIPAHSNHVPAFAPAFPHMHAFFIRTEVPQYRQSSKNLPCQIYQLVHMASRVSGTIPRGPYKINFTYTTDVDARVIRWMDPPYVKCRLAAGLSRCCRVAGLASSTCRT